MTTTAEDTQNKYLTNKELVRILASVVASPEGADQLYNIAEHYYKRHAGYVAVEPELVSLYTVTYVTCSQQRPGWEKTHDHNSHDSTLVYPYLREMLESVVRTTNQPVKPLVQFGRTGPNWEMFFYRVLAGFMMGYIIWRWMH